MERFHEIRDPIYGFIKLNEWEWDIVNHPVFQRLRRIRQLGLTDMIYPGATHTRFEHSLGVMHVATRMFDEIVSRRKDFLRNKLSYNDVGLERDRAIVCISALLHDIGHAPFSHAAEELMPRDASGKKYEHENYSAAAVIYLMQDVIENHPYNQNYHLKAQDISDFLNKRPTLGRTILWHDILSSQLDADRADYLLRDSHHMGVSYGKYDLDRLLVTLTVAIDPEINAPRLAVEYGGMHTAEALILARYMMFTQVYFHHTRRAYDYHLARTLGYMLAEDGSEGTFSPPTGKENMRRYLEWSDWRVLGLIDSDNGGEHGRIIKEREHYRKIFETPEVPNEDDLALAEEIWEGIDRNNAFADIAGKSWYKFDGADIPIVENPGGSNEKLIELSRLSSVINGMKSINQRRIYVPKEKKEETKNRISAIFRGRKQSAEGER